MTANFPANPEVGQIFENYVFVSVRAGWLLNNPAFTSALAKLETLGFTPDEVIALTGSSS
jgi:hypothetical protein